VRSLERGYRIVATLAALLLLNASPGPNSFAAWPNHPDSLVILHTNDIHAHLLPYEDSKGAVVGGAAARAALIERLRVPGRRTLLLDAGDVFQGTPLYNFFRGVPDYRSMALMRYDAGALGNHELDDGPAYWLHARSEAPFPILSANVFVAADSAWAEGLSPVPAGVRRGARWIGGVRVPDDAPLRFLATPYVVREVGGVKIAILGLTTSEIVSIVSRARNPGVAVSDPIQVASALVPELRKRADLVIALTHVGVDVDRELASRVPGIDLIVGGHSHTFLWQPVLVPHRDSNGARSTPIVQAGRWGERVGRVALAIGPGGIGGITGALIPVRPGDGEDRQVATMLQPFRDSIATAMDKPVFQSRAPVSMSGLEQGETPLGDFVADVILETARADLAIMNSGGIRASLPQGVVTVGDIYTVLPFDNTIVTIPMKGWQVRELLDFIARRLGKGGFAQVSGVQFVIRRGRAAEIRVGGTVLESDRVYRVATIDFLYGGGDGYTMFEKAGPAEGSGIFTRDAAINFLRKHPGYEFKKRGRFRWEGSLPTRDLLHFSR
jgi:2',3'-cyclic-nucleotide 2'-phosphodiesterase (5'-nucleotidase family)